VEKKILFPNVFADVFQFNYYAGNERKPGRVNLPMLRQAVDHCEEEGKELNLAFIRWLQRAGECPPYEEAKLQAEIADGAIDLIYVAANVLFALGVDVPRCWNEIQHSNLSKFPDCPDCDGFEYCSRCNNTGKLPPIKNADGKVMKPRGWVAPNLVSIIQEDL